MANTRNFRALAQSDARLSLTDARFDAADGPTLWVEDPTISRVAHADRADMDPALRRRRVRDLQVCHEFRSEEIRLAGTF